jgi:hypothetical protein
MTTTATIITDAYRKSNLVAIGVAITPDQQTEGSRYLNRIVRSTLGNEAGEPLTPFPIGRKNINRPQGYPWYDTTPGYDWFVPLNSRLMFNIEQSATINLHPKPEDGSRFAVIDTAGNFATYPVTIDGNGRNIDGVNSIILNTNGTVAEWFYRADLGNWQRYSPLALNDVFPFPEDFDDYFILMLATSLNPGYGVTLDDQNQRMLNRSARQLKSRYNQTIFVSLDLGLVRLPFSDRDRCLYSDWPYYNSDAAFDRGWP